MSEQNGTQKITMQRPANNDIWGWKEYWKAQGQNWRTEPEINAERQKFLAERYKFEPYIFHDIYPFKDIKLSRDDVEWYLATYNDERGPVDWNVDSQHKREGLYFTYADLRNEDLSKLPLAKCSLSGAQLQSTFLTGAQLQGANLSGAQLQGADLGGVQLEGVDISDAALADADRIGPNSQMYNGVILILLFLIGLKSPLSAMSKRRSKNLMGMEEIKAKEDD